MEWSDRLSRDSTEALGFVLRSCLATLEESIDKLRWQDVIPHISGQFKSNDTIPHTSQLCPSFVKVTGDSVVVPNKQLSGHSCTVNNKCKQMFDNSSYYHSNRCDKVDSIHTHGKEYKNSSPPVIGSPDQHKAGTLSGVGECVKDKFQSSPRSTGLHQHRHLELPKTILDVDYKLLQSGVTILPGCRDLDGNAVVLIFTSSSLWMNQEVLSTDLARLIMYCYSVPRETVRCRGLTIIADIRNASTSTINTLLESLYLFEGNIPQAISVVHLLSDKHTHSLVLKSPVYDVHASFKINLLLSSSLLCSYISSDQLPPVLDGTFQYNHEDWIRFRMRLDPFLSSCRAVGKYLVNVIQHLTYIDHIPASSQEATQLINLQESLIKATFEDVRVQHIQNEGDAMLLSLKQEEVNIGQTDDYRYWMDDVTRLYRHVQDTLTRLMRLADSHMNKLEKCLQLKEFDEECNKLISWLNTQGNEFLQRHLAMEDNLKGIRSQQREFEKFYYSAMTNIEKGNDLLEEASIFAQSGDFDEVTGYKELARMLKCHLHHFSERLEDTRERIEGTSKCYQLLDKTYQWALESMKYLTSMKMEHCATADGVQKLVHSLDLYLQEHPAIADGTFTQMSNLAKHLENDKLFDQCVTAQNRYFDAQRMFTLRANTLQQFRDHLELESSGTNDSGSNTSSDLRNMSDMCKYNAGNKPKDDIKNVHNTALGTKLNEGSKWQPKSTSTPVVPNSYCQMEREKHATLPSSSSPSHSISQPLSFPSHSSIVSISPSDYDDLRPFTSGYCAPVCRSDVTYRKPHQLKLSGACVSDNLTQDHSSRVSQSSNVHSCHPILPMDGSTSRVVPDTDRDSQYSPQRQPPNLMLHREISIQHPAVSLPILEEDQAEAIIIHSVKQNGNRDSMTTGSSDSLFSLPEDLGEVTSPTEESKGRMKREWTPVPVNTHLTEQSCNTLQPLADLKLSEAEIKSKRTLSLIMSEMVQTERDYVFSLRFIVEQYIPEMEREDVPQALRGQRNIIFGNIEKILLFHQHYFLQEMEASKRNPFLIARYFLMHEQQFHLYALYNKNKPKSDILMAEYGKNYFREKQLELGDKMDLSSYLLKPVQRMGKYALLIKLVLKECPLTAPEYPDLKAAEDMIRFQLRHGNDLLAMDALRECDVNLQEQGRLLRQDEFLVYHGRRKCMRHVFLFEDLILFSKTRRSRTGFQDTYLYKYSFKMSDIGLTQDYEGSGYKFEIWWRRRNSGESYVLQASSSEVKRVWVKDMTKVLWNQAIKNRENRLSELATMGIGNKPCLDIKPSSDNIHDRFVNIAVGNKEARTRNSIAVCSTDHLRLGNKRPLSVTSMSSNSSCNSGQSGFGTPSLTINPTESPRNYRRSLTFMSTESGLGTSIVSGADMDTTLKSQTDLTRNKSPLPYGNFQFSFNE